MGTTGAVSKKLGPMMKAARFGDVYRLREYKPGTLVMFIGIGTIERRSYAETAWIGIRLGLPHGAEDFVNLDYRHTWEKVSDAAD